MWGFSTAGNRTFLYSLSVLKLLDKSGFWRGQL